MTEDNPGQMTPYTQEKNNCDTDQQQVLPVSNLLTSSSSESRVVALSTGNTAEKANRFMVRFTQHSQLKCLFMFG